jgi:hypothetical protein
MAQGLLALFLSSMAQAQIDLFQKHFEQGFFLTSLAPALLLKLLIFVLQGKNKVSI